MDKTRLKEHLAAGLSLEQIGKLEGKHPSTVAYWLKKHALVANGREQFAPRGGLKREVLEHLVAEGLTLAEIGRRGRSQHRNGAALASEVRPHNGSRRQ